MTNTKFRTFRIVRQVLGALILLGFVALLAVLIVAPLLWPLVTAVTLAIPYAFCIGIEHLAKAEGRKWLAAQRCPFCTASREVTDTGSLRCPPCRIVLSKDGEVTPARTPRVSPYREHRTGCSRKPRTPAQSSGLHNPDYRTFERTEFGRHSPFHYDRLRRCILIYLKRDATLSACGRFRFSLVRRWDPLLPRIAFVGLNPSTADANVDDQTIKRCVRFASDHGFGELTMLNLWAFRTTYPRELPAADVGFATADEQRNLDHIALHASGAARVVAVWGNSAPARARMAQVVPLVVSWWCLRTTKNGMPAHPARLPANLRLRPWSVPSTTRSPSKR